MLKKYLRIICIFISAFLVSVVQLSLASETLFGSKPILLLEAAKNAADVCEKMAREKNLQLSIAIVDDGARLLLFRRMSGSSLGSVDIAIGKAQTSVRVAYSTRGITDSVYGKKGQDSINPGLAHVPGIVTMVGGLPIIVNGHLIGGIGISGASGDLDEACAKAALSKLNLKN